MTKTITVRDEVYERLMRVRREGESFSDLLERLLAGGGSPRDLDEAERVRRVRG